MKIHILMVFAAVACISLGIMVAGCPDDSEDKSDEDICSEACQAIYDCGGYVTDDNGNPISQSDCVDGCVQDGMADCAESCMEDYSDSSDCEALFSCGSGCGAGTDDDDDATDDDAGTDHSEDCANVVGNLYESCGYAFNGESGQLTEQEAYDSCVQGWDDFWSCALDCLNGSQYCEDYASCLESC